MKLAILFIFSICFSYSVVAQKSYSLPISITPNDYMANTIIIKVKPSYASVCSNTKINHGLFNTLATAIGMYNLHKKFPLDKTPEKEFKDRKSVV